jgi:hypothetical protein
MPEAYSGIKQASLFLREAGVARADRIKILRSFESGTVQFGEAGARQFGIRYFGGDAKAAGSFLFDTFPASRQSLALLPEWNAMTGLRQFQIRPGTTMISGRAAAQGIGRGLEGGQVQRFILDVKGGLIP